MRKWLTLACIFTVTTAAAQPAPPPPSSAPEPIVPQWAQIETIETIESHASPGPALWHITKGNSEVFVLGMIGNLPKGVTWNSKHLADVMTGAHTIITPPSASFGALEVSWFIVTHCCSLFRLEDGKLDDFLPEPTRLRLATMRESVGGDAKLYQGDEPLGAANRLGRDFAKKYELDGDNPMKVVNKLISEKHVKEQPAFRFEVIPLIKEALKLTPQQQRPCLETAMEDTIRQKDHARPMAEAWAVGDIADLKTHFAEPRTQDCLVAAVHAMGALEQNRVPGFVTAIDAALEKPGKTMVVIGMGPLLRKGGVLELLEAQHLTIEGPPE